MWPARIAWWPWFCLVFGRFMFQGFYARFPFHANLRVLWVFMPKGLHLPRGHLPSPTFRGTCRVPYAKLACFCVWYGPLTVCFVGPPFCDPLALKRVERKKKGGPCPNFFAARQAVSATSGPWRCGWRGGRAWAHSWVLGGGG